MLGAGLMGAGIATVLADKGVTVRLKDRDHDGIARGFRYARKYFDKAVKRRRYRSCGKRERLERIGGGIGSRRLGR